MQLEFLQETLPLFVGGPELINLITMPYKYFTEECASQTSLSFIFAHSHGIISRALVDRDSMLLGLHAALLQVSCLSVT